MTYATRTTWTFESIATDPSGVTVRTVITVPTDAAWESVQECGEVAQMGSSQTLHRVLRNAMDANEKVPF